MPSLRRAVSVLSLMCVTACVEPTPADHAVAEITPTCGNGVLEGSERCDDGNARAGDGCSASCRVEPGWVCRIAGHACEARVCGTATDPTGAIFMRGNYIEVGLHPNGAFGSAVPPPSGWHPRTDTGPFAVQELGFVSDPAATHWTDYHGDFFTPGSPEESWSLDVGGAPGANSRNGPQTAIAGSWGPPTCATGGACGGVGGAQATWTSTAPYHGVAVSQTYSVIDGAAYVVVDVTLSNTTGAPLTDVYYARSVDPDNDETRTMSYVTTNTIISQPGGGVTLARVDASQSIGGVASSLSLVADDARARVTYGGFSNYAPADIWNGVGGLSQSGSDTDDEAVAIAFKVDIPAGGSATFRYAYNLEASPAEVLHCVARDSDGDGIPDSDDPFPDDPHACGDSDLDGCDDCANGTANPRNDGPDFDGDGVCDLGDSDNDNDGLPDNLWVPIGGADFDGDGHGDMLWRNTSTGRVTLWFMNGALVTGTQVLWSGDPGWVPIAVADFDGDGVPDVVFRYSSTGRTIVRFVDRVAMTLGGSAVLWTGDPAWVPVAAGDFNGDGVPDLVWRNATTGKVIVRIFDRASMTLTGSVTLWTGDPAWVPVAVADLDLDGVPDMVWRNTTTGRVIIRIFDRPSMTLTGSVTLWTGDPAWSPLATADLVGDGEADLVWRFASSGRVIVRQMSGTTMGASTPVWQ